MAARPDTVRALQPLARRGDDVEGGGARRLPAAGSALAAEGRRAHPAPAAARCRRLDPRVAQPEPAARGDEVRVRHRVHVWAPERNFGLGGVAALVVVAAHPGLLLRDARDHRSRGRQI